MIIGIKGETQKARKEIASMIQYLETDWIKIQKGYESKVEPTFSEWQESVWNKPTVSGWETKSFEKKVSQISKMLIDDKDLVKTIYHVKTDDNTLETHNYKEDADTDLTHYEDFYNNRVYIEEETYRITQKDINYHVREAMKDKVHLDIWVNALLKDYKQLEPTRRFETTDRKVNLDNYRGKCITCNKLVGTTNKRFVKCNDCCDTEKPIFPNWIVTDVQYRNEEEAIKAIGGAIIVLEDKPKGKKNCGCGEGLCDVVGSPIPCKYTGRLELETPGRFYMNYSEDDKETLESVLSMLKKII